jgi:hypothetical protein
MGKLATYEIIWSSRFGGQGAKTVEEAAIAQAWADEFRDSKGADRIVIKRNGERIAESDLPDLMLRGTEERTTRPPKL